MEKYYVEIASADDVDRPDPKMNNTQQQEDWDIIAVGTTPEEVLKDLVESANNENFSLENSWLRIRKTTS